jgi:hypothetical protein
MQPIVAMLHGCHVSTKQIWPALTIALEVAGWQEMVAVWLGSWAVQLAVVVCPLTFSHVGMLDWSCAGWPLARLGLLGEPGFV